MGVQGLWLRIKGVGLRVKWLCVLFSRCGTHLLNHRRFLMSEVPLWRFLMSEVPLYPAGGPGAGGPRTPRRAGLEPPPLPKMLAFGVWNARVWMVGCSRVRCGVKGVGGEEDPLRDMFRACNISSGYISVTRTATRFHCRAKREQRERFPQTSVLEMAQAKAIIWP